MINISSIIDELSIPPIITHIHEVLNRALSVLRHHGILYEKPQLAVSESPSDSEWGRAREGEVGRTPVQLRKPKNLAVRGDLMAT